MDDRTRKRLEELKAKRSGENIPSIPITPSDDQNINYSNAFDTVMLICEKYRLIPEQVHILACQMQWRALEISQSARLSALFPKPDTVTPDTPEEPENEVIRIGPDA